jgi:hypothetical protein
MLEPFFVHRLKRRIKRRIEQYRRILRAAIHQCARSNACVRTGSAAIDHIDTDARVTKRTLVRRVRH